MNDDSYTNDLMTCVHCGLCLNACPTYLETGSEADSPRGRIVLMRALHEGRLSPKDEDLRQHIDACLGCRACETACPSAVPYGHLIEVARERIDNEGDRPIQETLARKALLGTLTHPSRMAAAMTVAKRVTDGDIPALALKMLSGDSNAKTQHVQLPDKINPPLPPAYTPAVGKKRARVGVLAGCVMRVLYGDTNADTVRVLAANGCEVLVNRRQGCCGALHAHNGALDEARGLAKQLIDAFSPMDGLDAIIVNSAGCGSMMKDYEALLADDPIYLVKARAFAAKVRDVSEYLDELGWVAPLQPLSSEPLTMTYHDACHLAHGQGVRDAPRALLGLIPGATLVSLKESEICCGSAGIYNLTEPEMATRLRERKIANIRATGASVVATGNPGCLSWINSGLAADSENLIRVAHPVTLLAEALCPPTHSE
ncbi:MAG: heterodisulfide reductase-related iron-sulfur binding cluster [Capsulimonas sp.]|uniref:(Fe-S)-binding protein n=1 Tax=Capsulimonas sp. TaxID=2494211 RepID=UPI0032661199